MSDRSVRKSFHNSILKTAHADMDTIVVDELGLKNGNVRADIAVLNGKMVGYEIKTDKDTLKRLQHQILAYNEVFDEIYIVTGMRYLAKVIQIIPQWWGVFLIETFDGEDFRFKKYRKAKKNKQKVCLGIAQLLWKDELIEILKSNYNFNLKGRMTKQNLYTVLQENSDANKLGKIALKYLKCREGWRIDRKVLS